MLPEEPAEPWHCCSMRSMGRDNLLEVSQALWGGLITPGEVGEKKEFYVSSNLRDYEMFPSVIFLKLKSGLLRFTWQIKFATIFLLSRTR